MRTCLQHGKKSERSRTLGARLSSDCAVLGSHPTPESPILGRVEMIILSWLTLELGVRATKMMHYTMRNPSQGVQKMTCKVRLNSNTRLTKTSKSEEQCHDVLSSVPLEGLGCATQVTFNLCRAPSRDLGVPGNPFHFLMVLSQSAVLGDQS